MKRETPRALGFLDDALADARRQGLLRERRGPEETPRLSYCSNDYLGLASRPGPPAACGAGASRLVSGDRAVHGELERAAADLVRQPSSLVFTSGYAANVGLLAALAGPGDLIVSDALNHASIIDGARLSRARVAVVPHLDGGAVARALEGGRPGRAFVVTESYFSMDADSPDLRALRGICDAHGAALIVDEAHAVGVLGAEGRGLCADGGVRADAVVGTFGKAFGAGGAFVAGCPALMSWLWNRARSFVFSTGLSPVVAAAALDGVRRSRDEPWRRQQALKAAAHLREGLIGMGARLAGSGHVIPWVVGEAEHAVRLAEALQARGVDVRAIRPPTVPPGTARIRLTVTADHTLEDVNQALEAVAALRASPGMWPQAGDTGSGPGGAPHDAGHGAKGGEGVGWLVVVAGTGTSVGKTHFAEALIRAWRQAEPAARIVGMKPIESGVADHASSDAARLEDASSFHVKQFRYALSAPLSPHLAARDEGVEIRVDRVVDLVTAVRRSADGVVVELPGGLFTPLGPGVSNADLAGALSPDSLVVVAPDRLGVLHDLAAAIRAASTLRLRVDGVVLVTPEQPDGSTERNASEVRAAAGVTVLAVLPRGSAADLSRLPAMARMADDLRTRARRS